MMSMQSGDSSTKSLSSKALPSSKKSSSSSSSSSSCSSSSSSSSSDSESTKRESQPSLKHSRYRYWAQTSLDEDFDQVRKSALLKTKRIKRNAHRFLEPEEVDYAESESEVEEVEQVRGRESELIGLNANDMSRQVDEEAPDKEVGSSHDLNKGQEDEISFNYSKDSFENEDKVYQSQSGMKANIKDELLADEEEKEKERQVVKTSLATLKKKMVQREQQKIVAKSLATLKKRMSLKQQ